MSFIISGIGLQVRIVASVTFPTGFTLTQFTDDADAFDSQSLQVADVTMGLNGDALIASKATVIPVVLGIIPNSDDDELLAILLQANRAGKGKTVANDIITMTPIFPDGSFNIFSGGAITDGMSTNSVQSSQRMKSKTYTFKFENVS
jgi:hypothetical protein